MAPVGVILKEARTLLVEASVAGSILAWTTADYKMT